MVDKVSISSLTILESRFNREEYFTVLNYINQHSKTLSFISDLLASVCPVIVMNLGKNKYPIDHLDELMWLKNKTSDLEIEIVDIGKAKSKNAIQQRICNRYRHQLLTSINHKDLYGLEKIWQDKYDREPMLERPGQYAEMIGCERKVPTRHFEKLRKKLEITAIRQESDTPVNNVSLSNLTKHIPPKNE